jgi:hypothetical protein
LASLEDCPCKASTAAVPCLASLEDCPCKASTVAFLGQASVAAVQCLASQEDFPCKASTVAFPFQAFPEAFLASTVHRSPAPTWSTKEFVHLASLAVPRQMHLRLPLFRSRHRSPYTLPLLQTRSPLPDSSSATSAVASPLNVLCRSHSLPSRS